MRKDRSNHQNLRVLTFLEARDRSTGTTFLPDDAALSDCWPDWSRYQEDPEVQEKRAQDNSSGKVLFQMGLALAVPLALAAIVSLMVPLP